MIRNGFSVALPPGSSFLAAAFLRASKLFFRPSRAVTFLPPAQRLRYFSPKIQALLEIKSVFSPDGFLRQAFFGSTLFIVLVLYLGQIALGGMGVFNAALITYCLSAAVLGLFATIIPRALCPEFS